MTVFLAKGQVVAEQFTAGDVGYALMGPGTTPVAAHPGFCRCAPTMAAKARI
jgi:hypothetical protein